MHTSDYYSTIHNSRDLKPTQMPINDRLGKENVAHIHRGVLVIHKKGEFMSFSRSMEEAGSHHCQQTNTGTENQILNVLTYK